MDIFKKMAQNQPTDLSVFRTKHSTKTLAKEVPKEKPLEPQPIPEQEKEATNDIPVCRMETLDDETVSDSNSTAEKATAIEPRAEEKEGKVLQFKQPENANEEASIKLEAELETAKSNLLPVFPIVRYLKKKCMADSSFSALILDERKTLQKCFGYVTDEVKKALNGANGWLDDNEVYAYAETYYLTDEAVFEKMAAEKAEAEKKRREDVEKRRKEQEEKRKKAAKESKKKKAQKELVGQTVKEPESSPVPASATEQNDAVITPAMQEQLCLEP